MGQRLRLAKTKLELSFAHPKLTVKDQVFIVSVRLQHLPIQKVHQISSPKVFSVSGSLRTEPEKPLICFCPTRGGSNVLPSTGQQALNHHNGRQEIDWLPIVANSASIVEQDYSRSQSIDQAL